MMKSIRFFSIIFSAILLNSCAFGQGSPTKEVLSAEAFSNKMALEKEMVLLDVRSPKEYSTGHLKDSKNINWNDDNFDAGISGINHNTPVYVYCLSGGRSHEAAEKMRSEGFTTVYEMEGGMLKWRKAGLPEVGASSKKATKGMTRNDFEKMLESDKLVVVDFYAEWCGPCKKMKPFIEELERNMSDKVKIVRIDIDANPDLASTMKIDAIPVIQFYKDNKLSFSNVGLMDKKGFYKELKKLGIK